jgi:ATP-dependent Clp protease ATP-binding subunit ClpC
MSAKYVKDRFLPDKAIAVLDLAGSRARREGLRVVDSDLIGRVVAKMADIPESRLVEGNHDRLKTIGEMLSQRVVGHAANVDRITSLLRRNFAGFASGRPMASFLFAGPTGVGKTELAHAMADALFGSPQALVRLDMTEYGEVTGGARLIGAAPGYVGYGDGGQLTEAVRRRPSSVVVLDEIDKAHRDVLMLLLQVLEEGRLTDGRGRHVDFSNTVVVLTSNLGSEASRGAAGAVGFRSETLHETGEQRVLAAARAALPPELWNRLDEKLYFAPLDRETIKRIALHLLSESSTRLHAERRIRFSAGEDVAEYVLRHGGFDPAFGARPVRATIQRLVEAPIADRILAGAVVPGDSVQVTVSGDSLTFV